jgi:hypothetical protein
MIRAFDDDVSFRFFQREDERDETETGHSALSSLA